ncbi:MAG: MarR family transcriptional regulator [Steroidobacteraceae bacterium]
MNASAMYRAPEEQIGFLLKRLMHVFRHVLEARLRRSASLSFAHLVTLDQITEEPGIAGAQLARRLLVTAQTMTDLLKRLEREGNIERRPDPNNRRADRWFIRDEGLQRLRLARSAGGPVMTQMLSLLNGTEIVELRGYLERCVEGLERENRREAAIPLPDCPTGQPKAKSRAKVKAGAKVAVPRRRRAAATAASARRR